MPLYYFAYGSNMLAARLQARTPSARPVGVASLPGWAVCFHKQGSDGSGKGNIVPAADACVAGVLYRLRARELWRLDLAEGAGYERRRIAVQVKSRWQRCEVYVATRTDPSLQPYDWYRRLILAGLLENGIGGPMLHQVVRTPSLPDPRPFRPARLRALHALARFGRTRPALAQRLWD
ncbi:MAG: gamma-glutamylcyclotransferase [Thiohalocapsa sp.]|jgi:hypothetical protein|uniref:gamma-glutamylcyclotransferase family protein n=1 Tax=Thiohalocapsa sp. TaxID=2497641 RepID=UPI0025FB7FD3|nr:gamma-glutamylcyclotransferase family protein [Thiohalocapsa sp.]MCG6941376.1 gamma-glutamylcyclotransferase [Thiohalocapsa sp.]